MFICAHAGRCSCSHAMAGSTTRSCCVPALPRRWLWMVVVSMATHLPSRLKGIVPRSAGSRSLQLYVCVPDSVTSHPNTYWFLQVGQANAWKCTFIGKQFAGDEGRSAPDSRQQTPRLRSNSTRHRQEVLFGLLQYTATSVRRQMLSVRILPYSSPPNPITSFTADLLLVPRALDCGSYHSWQQ